MDSEFVVEKLKQIKAGFAALQAENEELRAELEAAKEVYITLQSHTDKHAAALNARIAELSLEDKLNRNLIESVTKQFDKARAELALLRADKADLDAVMAQNAEVARAAVCKWYPDDDCYWEGTCGVAWSLEDGTPRENDMNFCPKCGRKLVELPVAPEVE